MELKIYLQILLKKWWIVIPMFLATLISGMVLTSRKTPVYSATSTLVVAPSPSFEDARTIASVLDILGRRPEIATTYSEIAISEFIKRRALNDLSLQDGSDYSVQSKLRGGTNVLVFTVKGPNPTITRNLANAVAEQTMTYVQELSGPFVLLFLDEALLPAEPISPKVSLNLALSGVFGLVMGIALAFFSAYLEVPSNSAKMHLNIVDEETGIYNSEYFSQRLNEEMARAKRNDYPLSIALVRVEDLARLKGKDAKKIKLTVLGRVAALISQHLRQEDIVARFADDLLILLLPDTDGENAKVLMEHLRTHFDRMSADTPFSEVNFNIRSVIGVSNYDKSNVTRADLLNSVQRALAFAEADDGSKIHLLPATLPVIAAKGN